MDNNDSESVLENNDSKCESKSSVDDPCPHPNGAGQQEECGETAEKHQNTSATTQPAHEPPGSPNPNVEDLVEAMECEERVATDNIPPGSPQQVVDEAGDITPSYAAPAISLGRVSKITEVTSDFNCEDLVENNYIKGCKWAPDGSCILTCSEDNKLRIFNLPEVLYEKKAWEANSAEIPKEIHQAITTSESGTVFDYCWYPCMTSLDPLTCCIASCSKKCPVHLWDAFDGSLRATYNPYNQVDEVEGAYSLAFSPNGEKLYSGFHSCIRVFDVSRPGRICEKRDLKGKHLAADEQQRGIVSSISVNPAENKIYAIGSYQRALGLYGEPDGTLLCLLNAHAGGITHTQFSPDGTKLFSGSRKDAEILCWDLRAPGKLLASIQRSVHTNQRIYFDISRDSKYLFSGNTCGKVTAYKLSDIQDNSDLSSQVISPYYSWIAHKDCANGVSVHPILPVVATSSGQRHFPCENDENEEDIPCDTITSENSLVLWWLGPHAD